MATKQYRVEAEARFKQMPVLELSHRVLLVAKARDAGLIICKGTPNDEITPKDLGNVDTFHKSHQVVIDGVERMLEEVQMDNLVSDETKDVLDLNAEELEENIKKVPKYLQDANQTSLIARWVKSLRSLLSKETITEKMVKPIVAQMRKLSSKIPFMRKTKKKTYVYAGIAVVLVLIVGLGLAFVAITNPKMITMLTEGVKSLSRNAWGIRTDVYNWAADTLSGWWDAAAKGVSQFKEYLNYIPEAVDNTGLGAEFLEPGAGNQFINNLDAPVAPPLRSPDVPSAGDWFREKFFGLMNK